MTAALTSDTEFARRYGFSVATIRKGVRMMLLMMLRSLLEPTHGAMISMMFLVAFSLDTSTHRSKPRTTHGMLARDLGTPDVLGTTTMSMLKLGMPLFTRARQRNTNRHSSKMRWLVCSSVRMGLSRLLTFFFFVPAL